MVNESTAECKQLDGESSIENQRLQTMITTLGDRISQQQKKALSNIIVSDNDLIPRFHEDEGTAHPLDLANPKDAEYAANYLIELYGPKDIEAIPRLVDQAATALEFSQISLHQKAVGISDDHANRSSTPHSITRRLTPVDEPLTAEMIRDPLYSPTPDREYLENYTDTFHYSKEHITEAVLSSDIWYEEFVPTLHKIMTKNDYRGQSFFPRNAYLSSGEYRDFDNLSTPQNLTGILENMFLADVTEDADRGSWPTAAKNPDKKDLLSQGNRSLGIFFYPNSEYIRPALEQMRNHVLQALQTNNQSEVLDNVARAYWFVRFHPFPAVNNSIFMAMINSVLDIKGLNKLPHLFLDINTHWLSPTSFAKVFVWNYKNFAESSADIDQANASRARLEEYLKWRQSIPKQFRDLDSYPNDKNDMYSKAIAWLAETGNYRSPNIESYPESYKGFAIIARAYFLQSGLGIP